MALRDLLKTVIQHTPGLGGLYYVMRERAALMAEVDRMRHELGVAAVPPPHLRMRTAGTEDVAIYAASGWTIYDNLRSLVQSAGSSLEQCVSVLDFGCGCGRVARCFPDATGRAFSGTDVDAESIAWCRQYLSALGSFGVNAAKPPLAYADESFDLIYAISVFTHLNEEMGNAWLQELHRVLKPNGLLIATTQDDASAQQELGPASAAYETYQGAGFYFAGALRTAGTPEYYGSTFHTAAYVQREWGKVLDVVAYRPKAINNHQTAVTLRRRI